MNFRTFTCVALVALSVSGCRKYAARPLNSPDILARVEGSRVKADTLKDSLPFTFSRAVDLMRVHSPMLQELHAELTTALALANVKTPLPNPGLETGPNFGFGPFVTAQPWSAFGSIGFAIPTGGRLKRQDELNRTRAEQARGEVEIRQRELYLELRQLYTRLVLARTRQMLRRTITKSAEESVALSRKGVDAGTYAALDFGLMELEAARANLETLNADGEVVEIESELSQLIGVQHTHFSILPEQSLPKLPVTWPSIEELKTRLLLNHPQLARLRLTYCVAERELRLEIARQYPDFKFGPSYDGETGEVKHVLGLTLGLELPVFDRNQQAVVTAERKRDEVRIKYEAAANRALAQLERAHRTSELAQQKLRLLQSTLLPKARANSDLARRAMEAGQTDALRFLETDRTQRSVMLEALENELAVRVALSAIEQAVGFPLGSFPSEPEGVTPPPLAPTSTEANQHTPDISGANKETK